MHVADDNGSLDSFACDLARRLHPLALIYLAGALEGHAQRRISLMTVEQQWLGEREPGPDGRRS
jgi:hypothetical protein